jgi:hypothetical protein
MSYISKDVAVRGRQLKVQRLVIPFQIVGSATSGAVSPSSDAPAIMFLKTQGVDQITAALDSGDTATYSVAANDANGTFNVLLKISEQVEKVCRASCTRRSAVLAEADDAMVCALGSSSGVVQNASANADKIMLTIDGELALNAANTLDACLEVTYIIQE